LLLSCGTRLCFRLHKKAPQGFPIRIPRYVALRHGSWSQAHWETVRAVVENMGYEHCYGPKYEHDCIRLRDCEALLPIKIAGALMQVEEYLSGGDETPSLLCDWFGIEMPPLPSIPPLLPRPALA